MAQVFFFYLLPSSHYPKKSHIMKNLPVFSNNGVSLSCQRAQQKQEKPSLYFVFLLRVLENETTVLKIVPS